MYSELVALQSSSLTPIAFKNDGKILEITRWPQNL